MAAHASDEVRHVGTKRATRAGDSGERHAVDESARARHKTREPVVGSRWRVQVDPREPFGIERDVELGRFFGRQIGNDDARRSRLSGIRGEAAKAPAIPQEGIRVPHQEHRRVALAHDRRRLRDAVRQGYPLVKGDLARALDRRAVGERVAEWHPELQHVRSAVERGSYQRARRGAIRVPHGEVDDDRKPLRLACSSERAGDALGAAERGPDGHRTSPSPITISRSLSPRPERQTSTVCAGPSPPIAESSAMACAGSSAGMMPSLRERRASASSA